MDKRIFYIEWQHKCDSERMQSVLTFHSVEDLFDFFAFEEDPLVYFAFEDITDQEVEEYCNKRGYNGLFL